FTPDKQDEVLNLMTERARFMATQPGFVSIALHRSKDGTHVVNYVQWRDADSLAAAHHSPEFRKKWPQFGKIADEIEPSLYDMVRVEAAWRRLQPRASGGGLLLEVFDLALLLLRQSDVIKSIEQAMLAVRVDFEMDDTAVRATDFLLLEIDCQCCVGAALGIVEQLLEIFGRHADRQQAILEAVIIEDVAERR